VKLILCRWDGTYCSGATSINFPDHTIQQPKSSPTEAPSIEPTKSPTAVQQSLLDTKSITTSYATNKSQAGNMFDVFALKDIFIKSVDIHTKKNGQVTVEVWKKKSYGTFSSDRRNTLEWVRIWRENIIGKGIGQRSHVGKFKPLSVQAGNIQGMYVTLNSDDLLMKQGGVVGGVIASNSDLNLLEGVSARYLFGRIGTGAWSGALFYSLDNIETDSTPTPAISSVSGEVGTTFASNKSQAGNMFDIFSKRDLTIKSMDIHTKSTEAVYVQVYKKKTFGSFYRDKRNSAAWQLITSKSVVGKGLGNRTPIGDMTASIYVASNSIQGLYVTLTTEALLMTSAATTGSIYSSNTDLNILVGVSSRYAFGRNSDGNLWNGFLYYSLESQQDGLGDEVSQALTPANSNMRAKNSS